MDKKHKLRDKKRRIYDFVIAVFCLNYAWLILLLYAVTPISPQPFFLWISGAAFVLGTLRIGEIFGEWIKNKK